MTAGPLVPGVLDGVKVIDLTQMLAGPYATMLLADHGADVIKIEPPHGDMSRELGPFLPADVDRREGGYFHSINRNKRSVVLDLKNPGDRDALRTLVANADVVVENFRVGVMDRLGLSWESLHAENPRLVYAALRGFGDPRTGESPYANWPAFDIVAQAMGGFMSITGPGTPMKAGPGIGDIIPGILCAFGIVAAVRHAERTGEGQFLDVAMYDAMLAVCERIVYRYDMTGVVSKAEGNDHPLACPFSIYPASDGWVAIACPLDAQWVLLARLIGREDLAADPRLAANLDRVTHVDEIREAVSAWTSARTKLEIADTLGGQVPFGPVNDVADIAADPHVEARDMLARLELPGTGGATRIAGTPLRFTKTPGGVTAPGPGLGAHTAEVLAEFGLTSTHSEETSA